jgi:drug/metabolite transporter (DMT)-like permease
MLYRPIWFTMHGQIMNTQTHIWRGMIYGFIGMACFSLTAPFTRLALQGFSPYFITVGRVSLAGILAALILYLRRERWPARVYWKRLVLVSLGVSVGFPLSLAIALTHTDASHAGIVLAILPLLTSILGAISHQEKHGRSFWLIAVSGCLSVLAYIFWNSGIRLVAADIWLLIASISAAIAYSSGASVTRSIGGINTICWAMVLMLPFSIPAMIYMVVQFDSFATVPLPAFAAFLYLAFVSQLLGFFPWYAGLSLGGVARVSQVQLLQTFLTLFAAAWLLGEVVEWHSWVVAALVAGQVYLAKRLA